MKHLCVKINVISWFLGCVCLGAGGVVIYYYQSYQKIFNLLAEEAIFSSRLAFENLYKNDVRGLTSIARVFTENKDYKEIFLKGQREELFQTAQPLYRDLNQIFGITQFNFIFPENGSEDKAGKVFLRVQNVHKFGDVLTRVVFKEAVQKKNCVSGIEAGKTGFSLRIICPYYSDERLIGYMEFGEEIEHLLAIMQEQTSAEYGVLIDKKYLNREDWNTMRSVKGLRDNWNDLESMVAVYFTSPIESIFAFSQPFENIPAHGLLLGRMTVHNRTFVRGVFPLYDAVKTKVGGIIVSRDITPFYRVIQRLRNSTVYFTLCAFIALGLCLMVILHRFLRALADTK